MPLGNMAGEEILLNDGFTGAGEPSGDEQRSSFQKRKHYFFNSRRHTNLIARILILAVSVFGLTQLHAVPLGCEHQHCVAEYLRAGDGKVPTFELLRDPCSEQRVKCFSGEAYDYITNRSVVTDYAADYSLVSGTFRVYINYCRCLMNSGHKPGSADSANEQYTGDDEGYCNLIAARSAVFVLGLLVFFGIALSSNVEFCLRAISLASAHAYFIGLAMMFSLHDFCGSTLYRKKVDLLLSLIIGAEIVMVIITAVEFGKFWRLRRAGLSEWA